MVAIYKVGIELDVRVAVNLHGCVALLGNDADDVWFNTREKAPEPNGLSLRTTFISPGWVGLGQDFTEFMAGGVMSCSAAGAIFDWFFWKM